MLEWGRPIGGHRRTTGRHRERPLAVHTRCHGEHLGSRLLGGRTACRVLGEQVAEQAPQINRHADRTGQLGVCVREHHREWAGAGERLRAGAQLVEHDAQGIDVGRRRGRGAEAHLGCHVSGGADDCGVPGHRSVSGESRDAEVGQAQSLPPVRLLLAQHVGGLQVAVHDTGGVDGDETVRDLGHQPQRLSCRHRVRDGGAQVAPVHQLHDDRQVVRLGNQIDHLDDVGMADRAQHLALLEERADHLGLLGDLLAQDLDRDLSAAGDLASVHPAGGAAADGLPEQVPRTERPTGGATRHLGLFLQPAHRSRSLPPTISRPVMGSPINHGKAPEDRSRADLVHCCDREVVEARCAGVRLQGCAGRAGRRPASPWRSGSRSPAPRRWRIGPIRPRRPASGSPRCCSSRRTPPSPPRPGGAITGQGTAQPDAGQRAARAARVHRVWADGAQAGRLAAVQDLPVQTEQVRFVVTRWDDVSARPHSAHVDLVGRHERRASGEAWRAEPDRRWRVELIRGDPVGATRGWRLVSVVGR